MKVYRSSLGKGFRENTRLYWGDTDNIREIVKEYVKYEFGNKYTESIINAVYMLERTINRNRLDENGQIHNYPDSKIPWAGEQRFVIEKTRDINKVYYIISEVDAKLPAWVRNSWRWRILVLRSLIDKELLHNGFQPNQKLDKAYGELTEIYHAHNADSICSR